MIDGRIEVKEGMGKKVGGMGEFNREHTSIPQNITYQNPVDERLKSTLLKDKTNTPSRLSTVLRNPLNTPSNKPVVLDPSTRDFSNKLVESPQRIQLPALDLASNSNNQGSTPNGILYSRTPETLAPLLRSSESNPNDRRSELTAPQHHSEDARRSDPPGDYAKGSEPTNPRQNNGGVRGGDPSGSQASGSEQVEPQQNSQNAKGVDAPRNTEYSLDARESKPIEQNTRNTNTDRLSVETANPDVVSRETEVEALIDEISSLYSLLEPGRKKRIRAIEWIYELTQKLLSPEYKEFIPDNVVLVKEVR